MANGSKTTGVGKSLPLISCSHFPNLARTNNAPSGKQPKIQCMYIKK